MYELDWDNEKNLNIVWGALNRFYKPYMTYGTKEDIEDLFQEGCIALYEATKRFDSSRSDGFATFAYWIIRARISHYLTKSKRKKIDTLSIDHFKDESEEYGSNLKFWSSYTDFTVVEKEELLKDLYEKFPSDKKLIQLMTFEYMQKDIIEILNSTRSQVQMRQNAIREYIRTGRMILTRKNNTQEQLEEFINLIIPLYEQGLSYVEIEKKLNIKGLNKDNIQWYLRSRNIADGKKKEEQKQLSILIAEDINELSVEEIASKYDINVHNVKRYYNFYLRRINYKRKKKVS